ncbi:MAG: Fic family protein [Bacilli bacterium]|jgi:toxin-antitoxin system, toxin component, fic family
MKLEDYKSGEYKQGVGYKAFLPSRINHNWGWGDTKLDYLLAEANRQIGELNAYSLLLPNVDLYIKMHVTIEANKSSRIEGTKTTIEDDLSDLQDVSLEKRDDWEEVQNYVKATNFSIERINEGFPICNRLFKEIHKILLAGVRGEKKTPGEFRISQNWIGGTMPSTAVYVPPLVEDLNNCLTDLELFINNEKIDTPELIKIAIIHYQFESIHPFLDGNGRIGRLLIPLYLQSKKYLDNPCLYISFFFEKNRDLYYQKLNNVRTNNDIIGWIKFFLEGIIETAKIAKEKFKNVVELTKKIDGKLTELNVKFDNAKKVMDYFYNEPYSSRKKLADALGMPDSTVNGVVNELKRVNIIKETTGFSKNQIFVFSEYVNIFLS